MNHVYVCVITAIIVGAGIKFYDYLNPQPHIYHYIQASPSNDVKKTPKEDIDLKKGLKVYGKGANKKAGVPESVRIISSVTCTSDIRDQTVLTTVDPLTGETETTIKKDAYKWVQGGGTKELSLGYGFSNRGAAWAVTGRMDVAQILAAHIGVIGSVNTNRDAFAGIEARWLF